MGLGQKDKKRKVNINNGEIIERGRMHERERVRGSEGICKDKGKVC